MSLLAETITIRVTASERMLIEGLASMRELEPSDLLREMVGLDREDELGSPESQPRQGDDGREGPGMRTSQVRQAGARTLTQD
jgi:hypothetical protein